MPWVGLVLCIVWFFSLFILRSLILWARTGSLGINTFRGRIGSLEWFAITSATVGILLAPISPAASILDWPLGQLFFYDATVHLVGAAIGISGIVGALISQISMGESWRIGVDSTEETKLVTNGLFQYVRNPIFTFIGVSLVGFFLTVPNGWSVLAIGLTATGIQLQVRFVEEPYLAKVHGDVYRKYVEHVGRFIPRLALRR